MAKCFTCKNALPIDKLYATHKLQFITAGVTSLVDQLPRFKEEELKKYPNVFLCGPCFINEDNINELLFRFDMNLNT